MLMLLGISVVFVAIGVLMMREPEHRLVASLLAGFFGLGVITALVNLHPRASYLTLNERGFEFSSLFRRKFIAWGDVQEFVPISMHRNDFVGFFYAPTGNAPAMRRVSSFVTGIEAMLPDTYGHSNVELARLLNELRRKFAPR
jgi:hypothetical protein